MVERRIESGDVLSNANTIILMGKYRDGMSMGRPCASPNTEAARLTNPIVSLRDHRPGHFVIE